MTGQPSGGGWARIAGPLFTLRALGQGLEFVAWVVLARRLGASTLGEVSIAFLVARYAGLVADWGASISGSREVARDDALRTRSRALIRHRRRVAGLLCVVFVTTCALIERWELAPMVAVIAMLGLSRDWVAVGERRGARAALPLVVQGGAFLVLAIATASQERPALALGVGYGAAAVVSMLLNPMPRGPVPHDQVSLDPWMLSAVLTNQVLSSADTLILGALGTTTATGIYSAVYRVPNGWMAGVAILASALLPLATTAANDPGRMAQLRRSSFQVSLACAGLLLALTPVLYLVVPRLFGEEYADGRGPVAILLVATAVATAAAPLHQFYLATGDDRQYAGFLGGSAITIVVASLILVPAFSMTGAAVATLLAHLVLAGALAAAVLRPKGRRARRSREW